MSKLDSLVAEARAAQASDLHLEPGLPACLRVRGELRDAGAPLEAAALLAVAHEIVGESRWAEFLERRSCDVSRTVGGARCRINVFCTSRGVGLAIRFLAAFQATLQHLNLHPDLARLVQQRSGLVIVSGSTGSGKSTTLAALIQEVNAREKRHIVTLESPIEYVLAPQRSLVRQREVGRDTPSFEQGLYDALREDPDVLMVGELRDAETMRLTLNAAETGHLVLTTLHSSTAAEALSRIVSAFPAEIQGGIAGQLADCLVGVVCQRMRSFPARGLRAPECEVLLATQPVKAIVRQGQFSKLQTALETGGSEGCFTFQRYRDWLEKRTDWYVPPAQPPSQASEALVAEPLSPLLPAQRRTPGASSPGAASPGAASRAAGRPPGKSVTSFPATEEATAPVQREDGVLEIGSADDDLAGILSELERSTE